MFKPVKTGKYFLRMVYLLVIAVWFCFLFLSFNRNIFNIHFGDEDDNFLLGKYVLQGEKVYGDLFSHHQPLGYVMSAGVQKIGHPQTTFDLVSIHRKALFVWGFAWTAITAIIFGPAVILFSLVYEVSKRGLFGDQFLSESIAVYPLTFILFTILGKWVEKNQKIFFYLLGLAFGTIAFLLLPAWPALAFSGLLLALKYRKNFASLLIFSGLGVLTVVFIILPFVDLVKYFHNSFYINNRYYLRFGVDPNESASIKSFLLPIIAFLPGAVKSSQLLAIQLSTIVLAVTLISWVKAQKYWSVVTAVVFLGLAGIRFSEPGKMFYSGFHSLPWFAALLAIGAFGMFSLRRRWVGIVVSFAWIVGMFWICGPLSFERGDKLTAYAISHGHTNGVASVVNVLSKPGDRMFAAPGDWLLYWNTSVRPASVMLNYYGWMANVPEIKNSVEDLMTNHAPTFFYCTEDCLTEGFGKYIDKYSPVFEGNSPTGLLVNKNATARIDQKTKIWLSEHQFTIRE